MTNVSKCNQTSSKVFYGTTKKTSNFYKSKGKGSCYLTPIERKVLRERREFIKSQLKNSQLQASVKRNLLEAHNLNEISVKDSEVSTVLQNTHVLKSTSNFSVFNKSPSQKSPSTKLKEIVAENEDVTKPLQRLENSPLFSDSPPKLFPIFYKKLSPKKSPSAKVKTSACKEVSPAAVSPQSLHIALPGTPKTRRKPVVVSPRTQQMIIDAGQKKIGADQCGLCGMVYTVNLPHDQQQHSIYHKRFLESVKFNGWKHERVVVSCTNGRILKILPSDPKYAIRKVNEICTLIDTDLGFENSFSFSTSSSKIIYLFISDKHQVAGCLVAEPLSRAYRLFSTPQHHAVSTITSNAVPVVCGVSRLWTYYPYRRQGIATQLVNAVKNTFVLGAALDRDQIAFSDPTSDGIKFASRYCQTKEFLTYSSSCFR